MTDDPAVGLRVLCDFCDAPLTKQGALLFGPPDGLGQAKKYHACDRCYLKLLGLNDGGDGELRGDGPLGWGLNLTRLVARVDPDHPDNNSLDRSVINDCRKHVDPDAWVPRCQVEEGRYFDPKTNEWVYEVACTTTEEHGCTTEPRELFRQPQAPPAAPDDAPPPIMDRSSLQGLDGPKDGAKVIELPDDVDRLSDDEWTTFAEGAGFDPALDAEPDTTFDSPGHGLPLDPGIEPIVRRLRSEGVETFESCDGGPGHAFPEPTIRFHGERSAGPAAFAVAQTYGFDVLALRRRWSVIDGELSGPHWEMTFRLPSTTDDTAAEVEDIATMRRVLRKYVRGDTLTRFQTRRRYDGTEGDGIETLVGWREKGWEREMPTLLTLDEVAVLTEYGHPWFSS